MNQSLSLGAMKPLRYFFCLFIVFFMCLSAELLGEKEIIFPEIAALAVGAWLSPKSPWRVSLFQMVSLMTLSAVAGVVIVRWIPAPMPAKLLIGFVFTALILILSRTTMYPVISACILPVMMNTETFVYPAAVFAMTMMIARVRWNFEEAGMNEPFSPGNPKIAASEVILWLKRTMVFSAVLLLSAVTGEYLLIAPPLIVTFVEFSPYRKEKNPHIAFLCISFGAVIGFGARCLAEFCAIPLWLCACFSVGLLFVVFFFAKKNFPPAGAIALLPLILPADKTFLYPVEVILGCALLLLLDRLFFKSDS